MASALTIGCGGQGGGEGFSDERLTRSQYQAEISEIVRDSDVTFGLFTDLVAKPTESCPELIADFGAEVAGLVDRVAQLEPPAPAAAIQADFSNTADGELERIAEIEAMVEAGELSCGREMNDVLYRQRETQPAKAAIRALERQGYVVYGE